LNIDQKQELYQWQQKKKSGTGRTKGKAKNYNDSSQTKKQMAEELKSLKGTISSAKYLEKNEEDYEVLSMNGIIGCISSAIPTTEKTEKRRKSLTFENVEDCYVITEKNIQKIIRRIKSNK